MDFTFLAISLIFFINLFDISIQNELGNGYRFFEHEKTSLKLDYPTICKSTYLQFDINITNSNGTLIYGRNDITYSSIWVFYNRPGFYVNATSSNQKCNVYYLLDFFNNDWLGKHLLEIEISPESLSVGFDKFYKKSTCNFDKKYFSENFIEENQIYLGYTNINPNVNLRHNPTGTIQNMLYKSCGCNAWININIIETAKRSIQITGPCTVNNGGCNYNCACLVNDRSQKECICSKENCTNLDVDNKLYYEFDLEDPSDNLNRGQPMIIESYNAQTKSINRFVYSDDTIGKYSILNQQSLMFYSGQWMQLKANSKPNCFKKLSLCRQTVTYSFWLKMLQLSSQRSIIQHQSTAHRAMLSINTNYTRISAQYITNANVTLPVYLNIWTNIKVTLNSTELCIYQDNPIHYKCAPITSQLDTSSSRILEVGGGANSTSNTVFLIDLFEFSTIALSSANFAGTFDIILGGSGRYKSADYIASCSDTSDGIHTCKFDLSRGFYVNCIANKSPGQLFNITQLISMQMIIINSTSALHTKYGLQLVLFNRLIKIIGIDSELYCHNNLCFIELTVDRYGDLEILVNSNKLLDKLPNIIDFSQMKSQRNQFQFHVNNQLVQTLRVINLDRNEAVKRGLVITDGNFQQNILDFDESQNITQHFKGFLIKGLLNRAMKLPLSSSINVDKWLAKSSCIKSIYSCYNGLSVNLWFLLLNISAASTSDRNTLLNTGYYGLSIVLVQRKYLVVQMNSIPQQFWFDLRRKYTLDNWNLLEVNLEPRVQSIEIFVNAQQLNLIGPLDNIIRSVLPMEDSVELGPGEGVALDEIRISDVTRLHLYSLGYLSRDATPYKLWSFSDYQLRERGDFQLHGTASLVSSELGGGSNKGLSLSNFGGGGGGWSTLTLDGELRMVSSRRGWLVQLWLRPDNIGNPPRQVWLQIPLLGLSLESDMDSLLVRLLGAGDSSDGSSVGNSNNIVVISDTAVLSVQQWCLVELSWQQDDGLSLLANGKLVGHSGGVRTNIPMRTATAADSATIKQIIIGSEKDASACRGMVDEVHWFAADKSNIVYGSPSLDDVWCMLRDNMSQYKSDLGIIGQGRCTHNTSGVHTLIQSIPKCINRLAVPVTGCNNCWSLRVWLFIFESTNRIVMQTSDGDSLTHISNRFTVRLSMLLKGLSVELNNGQMKYWCPLLLLTDDRDAAEHFWKRWRFLEMSWDADEGLVMMIDREMLACEPLHYIRNSQASKYIWLGRALIFFPVIDSNDIKPMVGCIDQLELYRMRLWDLYRTGIVLDQPVQNILEQLNRQQSLQKKLQQMMLKKSDNFSKQALVFSSSVVGSLSDDFIRYKSSSALSTTPHQQQVKLMFQLDKLCYRCIIWANEYRMKPQLTSILLLHINHLVFTRSYSIEANNKTRLITEEVQINTIIEPKKLYQVIISYRFDKISVQINLYDSKTLSFVMPNATVSNQEHLTARHLPLLPNQSTHFIGGYERNVKQVNSSFIGSIYEAKIQHSKLNEALDIKDVAIQQLGRTRSKPSNIKVVYTLITPDPIDQEVVTLHQRLSTWLIQKQSSLGLTSPYDTITFNFSLPLSIIRDIQWKFTSYAANGVVFFIGSTGNYLAVEKLNYEYFLTYKASNISSIRTKLSMSSKFNRQTNTHEISLYTNVFSRFNLLFDNKLVIEDIAIDAQILQMGYLRDIGKFDMISNIGATQCIHFIKLSNLGYVNMLGNPQVQLHEIDVVNNSPQLIKRQTKSCFLLNAQNVFTQSNSKVGVCRPHYPIESLVIKSQLLSIWNLHNSTCDCFTTNKQQKPQFIGQSYIWQHQLLLGRDATIGPCIYETPSLFVGNHQSNLIVEFPLLTLLRIPQIWTIDFSFKFLSTEPKKDCALLSAKFQSVIDSQKYFYVMISIATNQTLLIIAMFNNNKYSLSINQPMKYYWTAIRLSVITKQISVQLGTITKELSIPELPCVMLHKLKFGSENSNYLQPLWIHKPSINYQPISLMDSFVNITHKLHTQPTQYIQSIGAANQMKSLYPMTFLNTHITTSITYNSSTNLHNAAEHNLYFKFIVRLNNAQLIKNYSYSLLGLMSRYSHYKLQLIQSHGQLHCVYTTTPDRTTKQQQHPTATTINLMDNTSNYTTIIVTIDGVYNNISMHIEQTKESYRVISSNTREIWQFNEPPILVLGRLSSAGKYYYNRDLELLQQPNESFYGCIDYLALQCTLCDRYPVATVLDHPLASRVSGSCQNVDKCNTNSCARSYTCETINSNSIKCVCQNGFDKSIDGLCTSTSIATTTVASRKSTSIITTTKVTPQCPYLSFYRPSCLWHGMWRCSYQDNSQCNNNGLCFTNVTHKLCNCDNTLFQGDLCNQAEQAFNPVKDGAVLMHQMNYPNNQHDQLRILFDCPSNSTENKQRQYHVMTYLNPPRRFSFDVKLVNSSTLILLETYRQWTQLIGQINKTNPNILLINHNLVGKSHVVKMMLNQIITTLTLPQISMRFKRSLSSRSVVVGCNSRYLDCFNGSIGGFRWNRKTFLDKSNQLLMQNTFVNISLLMTTQYPHYNNRTNVPLNIWNYTNVLILSGAAVCVIIIVVVLISLKIKYGMCKNTELTDHTPDFEIVPHNHLNHNYTNFHLDNNNRNNGNNYISSSSDVELQPIKASKVNSEPKMSRHAQKPSTIDEEEEETPLIQPSYASPLNSKLPVEKTKFQDVKLFLIKDILHQLNLSKVVCRDLLTITNTRSLLILTDSSAEKMGQEIYNSAINGLILESIHETLDKKYIYARAYHYKDNKLFKLISWRVQDLLTNKITPTLHPHLDTFIGQVSNTKDSQIFVLCAAHRQKLAQSASLPSQLSLAQTTSDTITNTTPPLTSAAADTPATSDQSISDTITNTTPPLTSAAAHTPSTSAQSISDTITTTIPLLEQHLLCYSIAGNTPITQINIDRHTHHNKLYPSMNCMFIMMRSTNNTNAVGNIPLLSWYKLISCSNSHLYKAQLNQMPLTYSIVEICPVKLSSFYLLLSSHEVHLFNCEEHKVGRQMKLIMTSVVQMKELRGESIALLLRDYSIQLNNKGVWIHLIPAPSKPLLHKHDIHIQFNSTGSRIARLYNNGCLLNIWNIRGNRDAANNLSDVNNSDITSGSLNCHFYRVENTTAASLTYPITLHQVLFFHDSSQVLLYDRTESNPRQINNLRTAHIQ